MLVGVLTFMRILTVFLFISKSLRSKAVRTFILCFRRAEQQFVCFPGTSITKNVFCDWRMRTKACNQNIAVNIAPYTTVSRTMVSWKALIALLGELDDTDVDPAETLSKTTAELINDEFNINSMETCRICIQPATMHAVSLHSTYDKSTVAQMIRFCSGLEVKILISKMEEFFILKKIILFFRFRLMKIFHK